MAAGGVQVVIAAIVTVTVAVIAVVFTPATALVIGPGNATPIDKTCTAISAIRPDLRRKVRHATPHDQLQAVQDRITSTLTRVAMSIVEMIRADGNKDRKVVGIALTGNQAINQRKTSGQAASRHRNRVTATMPRGISN